MNRRFFKRVLSLMLLLTPCYGYAQDCYDYHKVGSCIMDREKSFDIYSQSKSIQMSPLDTVDLNIVFYGHKDYILSFCTHKKLYPIHFILIDPDAQKVLYDNQTDNYIESLGIGFDVTRNIVIRIDVLAHLATAVEIEEYLGCVGILIQYKNYPERKVNIQM